MPAQNYPYEILADFYSISKWIGYTKLDRFYKGKYTIITNLKERVFMSRQRWTITADFKLQMVKLFENGKSRADIAREYDITPSALDRWIKNQHKKPIYKRLFMSSLNKP